MTTRIIIPRAPATLEKWETVPFARLSWERSDLDPPSFRAGYDIRPGRQIQPPDPVVGLLDDCGDCHLTWTDAIADLDGYGSVISYDETCQPEWQIMSITLHASDCPTWTHLSAATGQAVPGGDDT